MTRFVRLLTFITCLSIGITGSSGADAAPRSFAAGSLIIPMDLAYQDRGLLQAYGLLFQLLRQGVPVSWIIDPNKTWHGVPCNTPDNQCAWDCAIEGSGIKCPYPTSSPDFFAATTVVWSDAGMEPGAAISRHGYRGGPFVIDAAYRDKALEIINAWNDQSLWADNPWAQRTIFQVVSVHEATAAFTGTVSRELLAAPTIAVFSDGNEDIATGYLRAAGIKQSNGAEFPAAKCGAANCGPGTANPDMLSVPSIMGDMGTCDAPNYNHKNGALFNTDGLPQYCQIMSMHWNVADREKVECGGGNCPDTQEECAGQPFTYHGHEVVAEVRAFLSYPVHFFAQCQAVNAYENTTPNPAWPYLDDDGRDGHFLTTEGMPPPCPCTDGDFECVVGGCNGMDCCLPSDVKEQGAGFMIASSPSPHKILHPAVPYNQLDGAFQPVGGSEPAYNLSSYLGTTYKNDREVTFITSMGGPGSQDVWMTGYLDGECDITDPILLRSSEKDGSCGGGKVSYLGGHAFSTNTPISSNPQTQGTRLFLNALYEADCVTSTGQPELAIDLTGPLVVAAQSFPVEASYLATYSNTAPGVALDAVLRAQVGTGVEIVSAGDAAIEQGTASWTIGSISGYPARAGDPAASGERPSTLRFLAEGDYTVTLALEYRVGLSTLAVSPRTVTIQVRSDGDGDGADGGGGGCCQTGRGASSSLLLSVLVLLVIRRRRNKCSNPKLRGNRRNADLEIASDGHPGLP